VSPTISSARQIEQVRMSFCSVMTVSEATPLEIWLQTNTMQAAYRGLGGQRTAASTT
jgi:hypothetical protein